MSDEFMYTTQSHEIPRAVNRTSQSFGDEEILTTLTSSTAVQLCTIPLKGGSTAQEIKQSGKLFFRATATGSEQVTSPKDESRLIKKRFIL